LIYTTGMLNRDNRDGARHSRAVKTWARELFGLGDDDTVLVSELTCSEPGCPPLETVIALIEAEGGRRQFKLHRALADITRADIAALIQGDDHGRH
jgi:hypothetical protein